MKKNANWKQATAFINDKKDGDTMENAITYSSKVKDDRSGWDIIKKNKETNEEEVVATLYD